MARFPRPTGAIGEVKQLNVGDIVYKVYGIWPPFASDEPKTIVGPAQRFADHPEYDTIHQSQASLWVFDLAFASGYRSMEFAGDYNLTPDPTHNDNYLFRSLEEARAARDFLKAQWEAHPDLIEQQP